jgi:predicted dehydrogenase
VLTAIRLGFNPPTVAAVHSQVQLEQCVAAASEGGADGVAFYNLAESPGHELDWIRPALRRSRPDPDLAPLRIGLIGCGGISEAYLRAAQRIEGVAITALADIDLEAAQHRADEFQIPVALGSAAELLERELDAVIIAVPPKWHADIFKASLAAGKHVLVEKPLGLDLAEADAMAAWAAASDRIVGVGLVHRYLPFYRVIRDLIHASSLGAIRQIRVRTGRDIYTDSRFIDPATTRGGWLTDPAIAGGGILMSSAIHLFSVCSFLLDGVPFRNVEAVVRALHPRAYPEIEDDVTVTMQTAAGCELLIEDSWARLWPFELEIFGERGRLQASGPSWAENVCLQGHLSGPISPAYPELAASDGFAVNAARFADRCPPLFDGLLTDFAASLRSGAPCPTLPDVAHARAMQAAIAAAYESARR